MKDYEIGIPHTNNQFKCVRIPLSTTSYDHLFIATCSDYLYTTTYDQLWLATTTYY